MVVARAARLWDEELVFNGHAVSVWEAEKLNEFSQESTFETILLLLFSC